MQHTVCFIKLHLKKIGYQTNTSLLKILLNRYRASCQHLKPFDIYMFTRHENKTRENKYDIFEQK